MIFAKIFLVMGSFSPLNFSVGEILYLFRRQESGNGVPEALPFARTSIIIPRRSNKLFTLLGGNASVFWSRRELHLWLRA